MVITSRLPLRLLIALHAVVAATAAGQELLPPVPPTLPHQRVLSTFEVAGTWGEHGSIDRGIFKEGDASLRWQVADGTLVLVDRFDFSRSAGLQLWVHSNRAEPAHRFLIYLSSEDYGTAGGDYYSLQVDVDWTGWRLVTVAFADFEPNRSPLGFDRIDSVRFYANGWDMTADPEVVLHLDTLRLASAEEVARVTTPVPTVTRWCGTSLSDATWQTAGGPAVVGGAPAEVEVVDTTPFTAGSCSLRFHLADAKPAPGESATLRLRDEAYRVWQGDTAWWRFAVRVETLDRLVPTAIWQWHGGQAPWIEIRLQPGDGRPQLVATGPGRHSAGDGVLVNEVLEDRWYDILCSTRFSSTAGEARCWVDDELRWHHTGATATGGSDASAEARCGLDRSPRPGQDPEGARGDLTTLQGPTAVAVRLDEGLEVMRDAFPGWIDLDGFELYGSGFWERTVP